MKKKKLLFCVMLCFICMFVLSSSVLAEDVTCKLGGTSKITFDSKIPDTVHAVILIIQIFVPVLLVIFGSIDFVKAVIAQKDDEIKKGQQTFIKRLIAGIIVFFVVAVVKLIVEFAAGTEKTTIMNCVNCFLNGTAGSKCNGNKVETNTTNVNNTANTINTTSNNG